MNLLLNPSPLKTMFSLIFTVLSKILKFVNSDAVSLLRARSTCSLWQTVIDRITPETYWQAAVRSYWPIFCAAYKVSDWKIMFACL